MKRFVIFSCVLFLFFSESKAQNSRYIIRFRNKAVTTFSLGNPSSYLSQRAIDRRTRYAIAIDSTDLPVPVAYITQLKTVPGITILNVSRWLNAATISTTDINAIATINALPFVQSSAAIAARSGNGILRKTEDTVAINISDMPREQDMMANYFDYGSGASYNEIHIHQGEFLHNIGLRGQGMQIAMLDGGFFHYNSLSAFDSANANGQFLSTWDFVARELSVAEDNSHGMSCLSTIAANIPGVFIGTSPRASFHLFRTEEDATEYPIEEFNWACGAERADSTGADVISSSLGYGYEFDGSFPDYPYSSLNGDITISAQAADLAAKKGLLVFNAAGNSGNDYWKMITTPADGDSVVAVGAVNTAGIVGSFSSYGPAPDGRVKPDLAGIGVGALIMTPGNTVTGSNGTSFACPKIAGLGTCLWQGFPEFNNMHIVHAMKEAGSIYTAPNDRIGYGIPDMKKAFASLLKDFATSSLSVDNCNAVLGWTSKDAPGMRYEIDQKLPGQSVYKPWKTIQSDALAGSLLSNRTYTISFSLDSITAGTISYRIQQVIDTTAAGFTAVNIGTPEIALASPCMMTDAVKIVPNPPSGTTADLWIGTSYAIGQMVIKVFDMNGSIVSQIIQPKASGLAIVHIPIGSLAKGKYIVRIYGDTKVIGTTSLQKL